MFRTDTLYFEIHIWVLYVGDSWTEQQAENALDALEGEIGSAVVGSNANASNWIALQHGGRSNVILELLAGVGWLHEIIPVEMTVTRGQARQTKREALANLLTAACTSAQQVFAYEPRTFGTATPAKEIQFPVVYVANAGAQRG